MWHGFISSSNGAQIFAKGKPYRESDNMITARTRKELFEKLDKAQREWKKEKAK